MTPGEREPLEGATSELVEGGASRVEGAASELVDSGADEAAAASRVGYGGSRLPGVLVVLVLAAPAVVVGRLVPVVGGPVLGLVLGACAGLVPAARGFRLQRGYEFAGKSLLQVSIVVLGTGLSLGQVARVGADSLPVMVGTLAVALGGAWIGGRLLGVRGNTQTLIGVGTAICGGSAIAATSVAIGAKRSAVAYSLATIFTFNVVALLVFPPVGQVLGMSAEAFGLWAGTAINDTSSVIAAGYAFSQEAGDQALVVKLTRSLMLVPIVIALSLLRARAAFGRPGRGENKKQLSPEMPAQATAGEHAPATHQVPAGGSGRGVGGFGWVGRLPWGRMVPGFLVGFVVAAGLRSLGVIPTAALPTLGWLGTSLITVAMVGIGLQVRPGELRTAGFRPLLLGAVLWVAVAASGLGLQYLTGWST